MVVCMSRMIFLFFCFLMTSRAEEEYPVGWHNIPGVAIEVVDFLSLHPEVDLIFSYFEGSWSLVDRLDRPRNSSFASLSMLDPDRAYWIHSNPIHSIRIDGTQGNIAISFAASGTSTAVDFKFSYSLDNGLSWKESTNLTGPTQITIPSTENQIIWFSDLDLTGFQENVRIRLDLEMTNPENSGFSEKFTIDPDSEPQGEPSPTLLNFVPGDGDRSVPTSIGRVDLGFSESLLASSILSAGVTILKDEVPIPTSLTLRKNILTVFLPENLEHNAEYRVEVGDTIQSARGRALKQPYSWSFMTEAVPEIDLFEIIPQEQWTETAVRKILHTFAFGGHASDAQIASWALTSPKQAIEEMLTLYPVNYLLSPAQDDSTHLFSQSLTSLAKHWSSSHSEIETGLRPEYDINTEMNAAICTWLTAATKRGLNPFYHKIGLFETNYHLAVNQAKDHSVKELVGYYDRVMVEHSKRTPYQKVLAAAALSPAIAQQYGHADNRFEDGEFYGNEDFAREIHQLFFGILGNSLIDDPDFADYPATLREYTDYSDYHEYISIRHTARALTDMETHGEEDQIVYGTSRHHSGSLEILGQIIEGATAKEKIESLVEYDIKHPESLKNLPVIITKVLADDFMDPATEEVVADAWKQMASKDFLNFIRAYAISTAFHNEKRVKYWTSFDRNLIYHNLTHTSNIVSYNDTAILAKILDAEGVIFFRPLHNVFGGQTGLEASESGKILKEAFNTSAARHEETLNPNGNYGGQAWERNWGVQISREGTNGYQVDKIAELLWNKLIADGLKNFGILERAQTYALLAEAKDFASVVNSDSPPTFYSADQISSDPSLVETLNSLALSKMEYLDDYRDNRNQHRWEQNYRIGIALAFMAATPYMFAQEGL